jgi:hypothetical protein
MGYYKQKKEGQYLTLSKEKGVIVTQIKENSANCKMNQKVLKIVSKIWRILRSMPDTLGLNRKGGRKILLL